MVQLVPVEPDCLHDACPESILSESRRRPPLSLYYTPHRTRLREVLLEQFSPIFEQPGDHAQE